MAFADFSLTDLYTSIVTKLNAQLTTVGKLFKDQTTGDYVDQIRYNSSTKRLEYWTGSAWAQLDISLATIAAVTSAGSCTGNAATATNATTHIAQSAPHTGHAATAHDHTVSGATSNTKAGLNALNALTSGINNTAFGTNALSSLVSTQGNVAIGYNCNKTGTGGFNTAVGVSCLTNSGFSGASNTTVGYSNLYSLTTGSDNNVLGTVSGGWLTTGGNNVIIGSHSIGALTTGSVNTGIGNYCLQCLSTGSYNCGIGYDAGAALITGIYNVALGPNSLSSVGDYSYCVGLGYTSLATANWQVRLGGSNHSCYSAGAIQIVSDLRDKTDVADTILGSEFILALRPVDYRWNYRSDYTERHEVTDEAGLITTTYVEQPNDGSKKRTRKHHGLIAQEVKEVMIAQGVDFAGYQDHTINGGADALTLGYEELIAPMIKTIQELAARIKVLEGV